MADRAVAAPWRVLLAFAVAPFAPVAAYIALCEVEGLDDLFIPAALGTMIVSYGISLLLVILFYFYAIRARRHRAFLYVLLPGAISATMAGTAAAEYYGSIWLGTLDTLEKGVMGVSEGFFFWLMTRPSNNLRRQTV